MNVPRVVTFGIFLSISMLHAQQQDVPAPDLTALSKEIESLEQKQKLSKASEKNLLMAKIQAATANGQTAASLYSDAVEEVQFKGKKDKVEAFLAWKKSHDDLLRSKEMQTTLLLHLRYLLLSLQRKDMDKPETQLPAVMAYLNDLIAADDVVSDPTPAKQANPQKKAPAPPPDERKNLLDKPLSQSVIVQWLRLGEWLPDGKSWEDSPGDVAGILEKNVRSVLREKKDPQLIQTWDMQMKVEADRITSGRSIHQADEFNLITRPQLLFKRAQDMIIIGQPNRALIETITLVRTYPSHPDFEKWVGKIRESIKPDSGQTSPQ